MAAPPGSAPCEHRACARVHRGRAGRAPDARRRCGRLPRRRTPADHADRGERALAGAAVVVAARQSLRLAGPPVRAIDHRLRVHPGGSVGSRRRVLRYRGLRPLAARPGGRVPGGPRCGRPGADRAEPLVAESPGRVGLALARLGDRGGDPRLPWQYRAGRAQGRALCGRPRGARPRGGGGGALAPRARAARQRRARAQRGGTSRGRRPARHRDQARAGARGARQHRDGGPPGARGHRAHAGHPARPRRRRGARCHPGPRPAGEALRSGPRGRATRRS